MLKGKLLEMGKVGKDGDLKGYKKRGEVSFSHRVMKHFITAFLWLCSSSDIINLTLCESKTLWKNCNTAVFKETLQTFAHSKCFVAKCLCMQILDQFCFDERKRTSLEVCCCLHSVLGFLQLLNQRLFSVCTVVNSEL